jgi:cell division protein FtsB
MDQRLQEFEKSVGQLRERVAEQEKKIAKLETERDDLAKQVKTVSSQRDELQVERTTLARQVLKLEDERKETVAQAERERTELATKLTEAVRQRDELAAKPAHQTAPAATAEVVMAAEGADSTPPTSPTGIVIPRLAFGGNLPPASGPKTGPPRLGILGQNNRPPIRGSANRKHKGR